LVLQTLQALRLSALKDSEAEGEEDSGAEDAEGLDSCPRSQGPSPASRRKKPRLLRHLVDLKDGDGEAALVLASRHDGSANLVHSLLRAGASTEAVTRAGYTALHVVCVRGDTEAAEILLAHGAHPMPRTFNGRTPRNLAESSGHHALAHGLLREAEAEEQRRCTASECGDRHAGHDTGRYQRRRRLLGLPACRCSFCAVLARNGGNTRAPELDPVGGRRPPNPSAYTLQHDAKNAYLIAQGLRRARDRAIQS